MQENKIMKNLSSIMLAGLTAGLFGAATLAVAQPGAPTPAAPPPAGAIVAVPTPPPDQPPSAEPADQANPAAADQTNAAPPAVVEAVPAGAEGTNAAANSGLAVNGAKVNIRGFTVDQTLNYLAKASGYVIQRKADTRVVPGVVDVVSMDVLSTNELINLLNKVLADNALTAVVDGKFLTVETVDEAKVQAGTPVNVWNGDFTSIPQDSVFGTYVILLHSLNPTEVLKDLLTLRPPDAEMNSNPGGNAIIMTARNSDVRHFAQIIEALDSSGNGDLEVFLLTYADSKAIAQELKDVFSTTDTAAGGQAGGGGIFGIFGGRGGRGGGGGGGGGGGAAEENPKRAAIHVNAVSDDQNNAVLVSAPGDIMPGISNLIAKLDIPQEDTVLIKVFGLRHADPTDIVNELYTLFPDPTMQANQQGQTGARRGGGPQFAGARGGGFAGGGAAAAGGGLSDRMKKQVTVNAVADARTQSVMVTASKDTMVEIEKMIDELDGNAARAMQVYVFRPNFGDVLDMQGPLQDLFGSTTSKSSTTQTSALTQRMTTAAQNGGVLSSSSLSGGMGGGGGGGGGGTTGLRSSN
jgi:type II secretory pathway component GspD/PulD (secretin)